LNKFIAKFLLLLYAVRNEENIAVFLSLISYSWFLIPEFVLLAIEGIHIFCLELVIGQWLRKCDIAVCNQVPPYLGGTGISSAVINLRVYLYCRNIIAWCLSTSFSCV